MRPLQFDSQPSTVGMGLERLHENKPRLGDLYIQLLHAVAPHFEQRRGPLRVACYQPDCVIAVRQFHHECVVGVTFNQSGSDISSVPICAVDGGRIVIARPFDLRTTSIVGSQSFRGVKTVALFGGECIIHRDLREAVARHRIRRAEGEFSKREAGLLSCASREQTDQHSACH